MLIPGEKEATINFSITIDNATARALNAGQEILEDIIILRLEKGRDYYVTVSGKYARSCFGMSVDELVMYAEPIRTIPLDPIQKAEKMDLNPSAALCVPKEVSNCRYKYIILPSIFINECLILCTCAKGVENC